MNLNERISEDMKSAMKAQNVELLSTLRLLRSAIQNQQIALGHELGDAEVLTVLEKQAKQRGDSVEQYRAGNRADLAAKESAELSIIETYLPQKMDMEALAKLVDEVIKETGAKEISDMGKVMRQVIDKAAGAADGKQISDLVKAKLS